jgi:hypothetical protein
VQAAWTSCIRYSTAYRIARARVDVAQVVIASGPVKSQLLVCNHLTLEELRIQEHTCAYLAQSWYYRSPIATAFTALPAGANESHATIATPLSQHCVDASQCTRSVSMLHIDSWPCQRGPDPPRSRDAPPWHTAHRIARKMLPGSHLRLPQLRTQAAPNTEDRTDRV